jgi:serine/threonine protein phosphatase PrpC
VNIWEKFRGLAGLTREEQVVAVKAEARSHVGHVRTVNEDRFLSRSDRGLWAVADGMGGHSDGVEAASIVIDALEDLTETGIRFTDDGLQDTLQHANKLIFALGKPGKISGATIVAARRDGDEMAIVWAGDSRAYRVSRGKVQLVTHDHSVVQELIDAGALSKADAKHHPQSNLITRALGVDRNLLLEKVKVPFYPGDMILLCSDGLSRSLVARDLTTPSPTLAYAADRLLGNALRRDGTDNATFILIERRAS